MKNIKNEIGLTLVELLATLSLFAIISIIIWNFFFQGSNYNLREVTQNQLQQETNLIVNTIQETHTKYRITKLELDSNGNIILEAKDRKNNPIEPTKFERNQFKYTLRIVEIEGKITDDIKNPIKSFKVDLKISSNSNEKIYFESQTIFNKLMVIPR